LAKPAVVELQVEGEGLPFVQDPLNGRDHGDAEVGRVVVVAILVKEEQACLEDGEAQTCRPHSVTPSVGTIYALKGMGGRALCSPWARRPNSTSASPMATSMSI
jgi:hypothetical protein